MTATFLGAIGYTGPLLLRLLLQHPGVERALWESNGCDIGCSFEKKSMKGVAGQEIQDCNLRFGLAQTTGLPLQGDA